MHRQVAAAVPQRLIQLLDEQALASDFVQAPVQNFISRGLHGHQGCFHPLALQVPGYNFRLNHRQPALPAADSQLRHRFSPFSPSGSRPKKNGHAHAPGGAADMTGTLRRPWLAARKQESAPGILAPMAGIVTVAALHRFHTCFPGERSGKFICLLAYYFPSRPSRPFVPGAAESPRIPGISPGSGASRIISPGAPAARPPSRTTASSPLPRGCDPDPAWCRRIRPGSCSSGRQC